MKIAVDAMCGDHAPDTIGIGEDGSMAIRKKRNASLSVAMCFLAEEDVDAVGSAGNSAAIAATARHFAGLRPDIRRPAPVAPLPAPVGSVLPVDAEAHAEANMIHLAQSAALAHLYLKVTEHLSQPGVGLRNLGQEPMKGTKVIRKALTILERSRLKLVGNIESNDLFAEQADAAICDDFLGNVLLKMCEGLSEALLRLPAAQRGQCGNQKGSTPIFAKCHSSGPSPLSGVKPSYAWPMRWKRVPCRWI